VLVTVVNFEVEAERWIWEVGGYWLGLKVAVVCLSKEGGVMIMGGGEGCGRKTVCWWMVRDWLWGRDNCCYPVAPTIKVLWFPMTCVLPGLAGITGDM
jgi:hypothetical protein